MSSKARVLTRKRGVVDMASILMYSHPFSIAVISFSGFVCFVLSKVPPLIFLQRTSHATELLCPQMHEKYIGFILIAPGRPFVQ